MLNKRSRFGGEVVSVDSPDLLSADPRSDPPGEAGWLLRSQPRVSPEDLSLIEA